MLVTSWSAYHFHQKECQHKMRPAEQDCTNATTENGLRNDDKPSGITLKPRQHWSGTVKGERAPVQWQQEQGVLYPPQPIQVSFYHRDRQYHTTCRQEKRNIKTGQD